LTVRGHAVVRPVASFYACRSHFRPVAVPCPMKLISQALLDGLAARADASPRGRAHHPIHAGDADPVQRFFVAANRGSYFRPHRHLARSELTLVLRGAFGVLVFDDGGGVTARYEVGGDSGQLGYEIPPATWHTLLAQVDGSTFLEVKQGPYNPATAAEYAPWAPAEEHSSVPGFLAWARTAQPGHVAPRLT
jgi:cupin fold WbuC family metalloprotein